MVSRRFSLFRIFVAINLDKSNYDYVNDYKILMYMLISFRIRDYLNLPLHSQTAPIFYTYINVFEILVASATLIVNIFILRQYVAICLDYLTMLITIAEFVQCNSNQHPGRYLVASFILLFFSLPFSPSRLNYESLQETTNSNASLSLNKAIRIEMSVDGDVVRLITALA